MGILYGHYREGLRICRYLVKCGQLGNVDTKLMTTAITGVDMARLADWVNAEYEKHGSWPKLAAAIARANPGTTKMPISDQGLINWSDMVAKSIKPERIAAIANYRGETYNETLAWLHGQESMGRPDIIQRMLDCEARGDLDGLSVIAETEIYPALELFMRLAVKLAKVKVTEMEVEPEVSISGFIQSRIKEEGYTIAKGIKELYARYPRVTDMDEKRLGAIVKGQIEPDEAELVELVSALSLLLKESISIDDLTDPGRRILLIEKT